jgi:chromosome segregation ATPase
LTPETHLWPETFREDAELAAQKRKGKSAIEVEGSRSRHPAVACRRMDDEIGGESLRRRLTRTGEDALGKLAQDLLENPLINSAITRAFEAREKAVQAQEVALGALNLPSAADVERLTRRVRSVSQRLEGIEDGVDRLDERLAALGRTAGVEQRLDAIEEHLQAIARDLAAVQQALPGGREPVPRDQERLTVPPE